MARSNSSLEDKQQWMRERHAPIAADSGRPSMGGGPFEPHYSVADLAQSLNLSPDAVRRLFEDEPGVLVLGGGNRGGKRRYTTLRIPKSVAERVYRRNLRL